MRVIFHVLSLPPLAMVFLAAACEPTESAMAREAAASGSTSGGGSFAVVELFTSEGCSSCPPADVVLSELVRDARGKGERVFPLSFHVDYWDRLGWKDPFSEAAFSRRQRLYGQAMNLRSVYTPQMIVNGTMEFVGSDRARAQRVIADALAKPAKARMVLHVSKGEKQAIRVRCTVTGAPGKGVVHVAVVERGLVTEVPRGENAGRKLTHDNVVRVFQTHEPADGRVETEIRLPGGVSAERAMVIAYLQAPSMEIMAAEGADLPVE